MKKLCKKNLENSRIFYNNRTDKFRVIKGKYYSVKRVEEIKNGYELYSIEDVAFYRILDSEYGFADAFNIDDYFYTDKELRKLKLEKINENS